MARSTKKSRHDIAALFAAVYAEPDDDAPRLVLADALQERGDPHGELIALQCRATRTTEQDKRIAAILRAHQGAILGPLAPVVRVAGRTDGAGKAVFRRGFLAAAMVALDRSAADTSIAWATVEELWFWGGGLTPAMRGARILHEPKIAQLVEADRAWGVRELHLRVDDLDDAARLETTANLAHVTALHIDGLYDWALRARFAPTLTTLGVRPRLGELADLVARATALPALTTLELDARFLGGYSAWLGVCRFTLARDARGAFTVAHLRPPTVPVRAEDGEWRDQALRALFDVLDVTALTFADTAEDDANVRAVRSAARATTRAAPVRAPALRSIIAIGVAPDGRAVFAGCVDGVAILDPETLAVRSIARTERAVTALAVSTRHVVAAFGSELRVFDHAGASIGPRAAYVTATIDGLAITPDERFVIAGAQNKHVVAIELATRKAAAPMKHAYVMDLALSPDGKLLAIATLDHDVRVVDLAKRRTVGKLLGHTGPVTSASFVADRVVTTSYDGSLRAWSKGTEVARYQELPTGKRARAACVALGGLVVGWDDGDVTIHELATLAITRRVTPYPGEAVLAVAAFPDGARVVVATADRVALAS